jgi:hypothetical protein
VSPLKINIVVRGTGFGTPLKLAIFKQDLTSHAIPLFLSVLKGHLELSKPSCRLNQTGAFSEIIL